MLAKNKIKRTWTNSSKNGDEPQNIKMLRLPRSLNLKRKMNFCKKALIINAQDIETPAELKRFMKVHKTRGRAN